VGVGYSEEFGFGDFEDEFLVAVGFAAYTSRVSVYIMHMVFGFGNISSLGCCLASNRYYSERPGR